MPWSSYARRSIATASSSLRSPHQPVDSVHVPKPTSDTVTSAPGKFLYLIAFKLAGRARSRRERTRDLGRKVSDHNVRTRSPYAGERLHHHARPIDPATLRRRFDHCILAADLVGDDGITG